MSHGALVLQVHLSQWGNIETNLSSGEGEGFNPSTEKRNVKKKDGHRSGEMMSRERQHVGEEAEEEEKEEEGDGNPV